MIYACDFETYVSEETEKQGKTWVWSSAGAEINGDSFFLHHSIRETYNYLCDLGDVTLYYHNLKFDGAFWLDFLLKDLKLAQANKDDKWIDDKKMSKNSFKYVISDKGQWYSITIKTYKGNIIKIYDSLKIIPFSLKEAGKAFNTVHQKLDMEYKGYRDEKTEFTVKEYEYIKNDVLCLKECIEFMISQGHTKSTIGGCCMEEYKTKLIPFDKREMKEYFPNVYDINFPFNEMTVGEYIRKSYRGGWCYLKPDKANKIFYRGATFDVNSLYPSMMHSDSKNKFPVGEPIFWCGNYIPKECNENYIYYFVRIKTRFYLKEGYLPTIQIKNNPLYKGTEYLETSDVYANGNYYKYLIKDGVKIDTRVEMVLTCTDFELIKDHYELIDFEILDGCMFYAVSGLFDNYINYFAEIKKKEKGALRSLAKLFLNNLYGQFAKSNDSSYKRAYLDDGNIKFETITQFDKIPGYIPIGSAITSYARNFTIRTSQKNYENFIYADTDSIHMTNPENAKGFTFHDTEFCCWKKECEWEKGIFVRQKTYMEISKDEIDIKCAGMTQKCKDMFIEGLKTGKYTLDDFKRGLEFETGKLRPKRIDGGIVLVDSGYKIK